MERVIDKAGKAVCWLDTATLLAAKTGTWTQRDIQRIAARFGIDRALIESTVKNLPARHASPPRGHVAALPPETREQRVASAARRRREIERAEASLDDAWAAHLAKQQ